MRAPRSGGMIWGANHWGVLTPTPHSAWGRRLGDGQTLTEAALLAIRTPGPMRAFHERLRARRGHQIATVAVARKLAVLFWHLLTRGEDYAYGRPMLTQKKLRQLELTAGAPSRKGHRNPNPTGLAVADRREHERQLCEHAELAYRRLVTDWQRTGARTPAAT